MVQPPKFFMERKATGKVRPKIIHRKFSKPLVVMEMEFEGEWGSWPGTHNEIQYRWRQATVEDLCKLASVRL